jgi:hypothetical protein
MATTLKQLINNVLPEIGLPTLSTVVGSTNQTARQALALANRTGRSLAKHNWRILIKRNVLTTASSADSYSLPSDFDRFIHKTEWNDTTSQRLFGPVSDEAWQEDLSGVVATTVDDRFQIRADGNSQRLFIRPVPTSSENLTFFYACNTWCRSSGGQRQSAFLADTDVLLLDEYVFELGLKWRLLRAQNRVYTDEVAEFLLELGKRKALDGGMKSERILGPVEEWSPGANVGETGFGA